MPKVVKRGAADPAAPFQKRVEAATQRARRFLSGVGVDGGLPLALKPGSGPREFTLGCRVDGLDWEFVFNHLGDSLHFRNADHPDCSVYAGDIADLQTPPDDRELLRRARIEWERGGFAVFTLDAIEDVVRRQRDWIARALAADGLCAASRQIRAINARYFDIVRSLAGQRP